jgi:hypothetical protein
MSAVDPIRIEVQKNVDALTALGRVVANWSYYEQHVDLWLNVLLNQPGAERFPKNIKIDFKRRRRLWRDLAKILHPEPDKLKRIEKIIDRSAKALDDRNALVHGYWTIQGDIIMLRTGLPKIKLTKQKMSRRYVNKLADEIASLIWDHTEFYQRFSIKIAIGKDIPYGKKQRA